MDTKALFTIEDKPTLPDWTRWAWGSKVEREWWMPLFQEASNAFQQIEKLSVVEGVRDACWYFVSPENLIAETEWAMERGLILYPSTLSHTGNFYSSKGATSGPVQFRVILSKPGVNLFPFTDDEKIGQALGYPECCRRAFDATWGHGQVDSTWEQWNNTKPGSPISHSHSLWRWMGIRLVSHMPCSYDCAASNEIANKMIEVGEKHGFGEQIKIIREVLNWPVRWSRLFGIAEIVGPCIKVSTRTDWTPKREEFEKKGDYFKPTKELWTDNGFATPSAMRAAHNGILPTIINDIPNGARVLDLGCGNGLFLRRLKGIRPDIRIAGVDHNAAAVARASATLGGKWWAGKIEDGAWVDWNPDVVLVHPGRLREMEPEVSAKIQELLKNVPCVYCYVYDDWQKKEPLETLCQSVGLPSTILTASPQVSVAKVDK